MIPLPSEQQLTIDTITSQLSLQHQLVTFIDKHREGTGGYIQTILEFCQQNKIEEDVAAAALKTNARIIESVRREAEQLHFLQPQARLPI